MTITLTDVRPELLAFVLLLEQRLRDHDESKGTSWKDMSAENLMVHASSKGIMLEEYVRRGYPGSTRHAVDLANFCMMIADVAGGLPKIERNGKQWPVMGYGNIAVGCARNAADPKLAGIVYLKLPSAREINEDCADLYPVGSQTSDDDTLACVYFKDPASIDQTIGVLLELKKEAFGEAE